MFSRFILLAMLMVTGIFAAAPTDRLVDGVWRIGTQTVITLTGNDDTLTGVGDSAILASGINPSGTDLVLAKSILSGTGSDSIAAVVRLDAFDKAGVQIGSVAIDSITTSAAEWIRIPYGIYPAYNYKIVLKSITGHTGKKLVLKNFGLYNMQTVVRIQ
jgi:hypothetical protein